MLKEHIVIPTGLSNLSAEEKSSDRIEKHTFDVAYTSRTWLTRGSTYLAEEPHNLDNHYGYRLTHVYISALTFASLIET